MKYLICIGHPSQFHLFKNIVKELHFKGHQIKILISSKDILESLFQNSGITYENVLPRRKSGSTFHKITNLISRYFIIAKKIKRFKPDILIGSEITLPILGKTFRVPSIVFSEDDAKIIPQYAKIAYPYASAILSPASCHAGKWEFKKIGYDGYQKLSYLHPSKFAPHKILNSDVKNERYFVLRFVQLSAYHDVQIDGITTEIAQRIIEILSPYGRIYITSERDLEPQFEKYRINIDPADIHSFLYFADLYIGDSQSMAVEAAMLGTPGIRFSDFAGEINVLEELEHKYGLTRGFKTSQITEFFSAISDYVKDPDLKEEFAAKRQKMLHDKIDVASFMVWFIENYPVSEKIMKENPDYQYNFK